MKLIDVSVLVFALKPY